MAYFRRGRAQLDSQFTIGAYRADPRRNQLFRDGRTISLEPKVMQVLCMLADYSGRVVLRSELIETIWQVSFGGDESLTRAVSILRKTFRDPDAKSDAGDVYIKTISKRGYHTVAPVSLIGDLMQPAAVDGAEHSLPAFDSYSIAVHTPECLACRDADAMYADIVGRDLTGLLARAQGLRVLAYPTIEAPRSSPDTAASVGYVVSSTLARLGDRLQLRVGITSRLTGRHILSWRKEEDTRLFGNVMDSFLGELAMSIVSEVQIAEAASLHKQPREDPGGARTIRATEMLRVLYSPQRAREIVTHLDEVIAREPDNAGAHASLAVQLAQNVVSAWTATPGETRRHARRHLDRAQQLAPDSVEVLLAAGIVESMIGRTRAAVRHLGRAVRRDPNNPHALAMLGWQTCLLTSDRSAIEPIRTAERLAPHHPRFANWAMYRGNCWLKLGDVEQALTGYQSAQDRNPNYFLPFVFRTCLLALLGRDAEAHATAARLQEIAPSFTPDHLATLNRTMPQVYGPWPSGDALLVQIRRIWPSCPADGLPARRGSRVGT